MFGCRHDRVLLFNRARHEIVLWDPLNGDHRTVVVPLLVDGSEEKLIWNGAVLCAAAGNHGHFKVVLVGVTSNNTRMFAYCYSSETCERNSVVSTTFLFLVYFVRDPGVLVGNVLYWMAFGDGCAILEFDLDSDSLAVSERPSADSPDSSSHIMRIEDGGLGWAILSSRRLQMWERKVCSGGVARWVLRKTEKMYKILGMQSETHVGQPVILGYAEDANVITLWMDHRVYMLELASLKSTKLWETHILYRHHPYTSSYALGSLLLQLTDMKRILFCFTVLGC
ncbi:hypothetical protein PR202_gb03428 [Eleusine coracana subsp. coracana]|uniref:F-box protein AT5G49610-like beta-propeller domain-containing protein n=1 Tax=Eleusine coracana subsp. coracana TaxID=191504 RepID=A0AAV5E1U5_ELECO|nr:hypothetical protein PR202_gb03428 [Eleusine coracana subsp. coracana]